MKNQLTTRQQVWLAAWTAAIQSAKYNPADEAKACLSAFDAEFNSDNTLKLVTLDKESISETVEDDK